LGRSSRRCGASPAGAGRRGGRGRGQEWPLNLAGRHRGRGRAAGDRGLPPGTGRARSNIGGWNWRGLDIVNAHERDPEVNLRGPARGGGGRGRGAARPPAVPDAPLPLERLDEALDATRDKPDGLRERPGSTWDESPRAALRASVSRQPADFGTAQRLTQGTSALASLFKLLCAGGTVAPEWKCSLPWRPQARRRAATEVLMARTERPDPTLAKTRPPAASSCRGGRLRGLASGGAAPAGGGRGDLPGQPPDRAAGNMAH
jgi:hypothetical protein